MADFDGDRWRFTFLWSVEAQLEARVLMMSTNNILAPASGKPIIVPTQDMVLGIYYLTYDAEGLNGEGSIFADFNEVQMALDAKVLDLHAKIKCRMEYVDDNGEIKKAWLKPQPDALLFRKLCRNTKMFRSRWLTA